MKIHNRTFGLLHTYVFKAQMLASACSITYKHSNCFLQKAQANEIIMVINTLDVGGTHWTTSNLRIRGSPKSSLSSGLVSPYRMNEDCKLGWPDIVGGKNTPKRRCTNTGINARTHLHGVKCTAARLNRNLVVRVVCRTQHLARWRASLLVRLARGCVELRRR